MKPALPTFFPHLRRIRTTMKDTDIDAAVSQYLRRRGHSLASAVTQKVVRDPKSAPKVLSWVWMAALYALSTIGAAWAIWEVLP